jgi:hypothetical protein
MLVTIKYVPDNLMRDFFCQPMVDREWWVVQNLQHFVSSPTWDYSDDSHEEICEEFFDITNNPSRKSEHRELVGNFRSISVGDVIQVDNSLYLCDSVGWKEISVFFLDSLTETEQHYLEGEV